MNGNSPKEGPLKDAVIRICLKCAVVNPAGPSESCPHLQLARFDGIDEDFAQLLTQVAGARAKFDEALRVLKAKVRQALHEKEAEVETPGTPAKRHLGPSKLSGKVPPLTLEEQAPRPLADTSPRRAARTPKKTAPSADPRQLELLIRQPPKGHA
jgi:hypothetical protein